MVSALLAISKELEMAERRMMAKSVIDTDAFMEMPATAQCLYFHLLLRADDEGFLRNAKLIMRMTGAKNDDMNILISKQYVIPFDTGVIVIKHWKIHNYIRKDRISPTLCNKERTLLQVAPDGSYSMKRQDGGQLADTCQTDVSQLTDKCQHRLGEVRLGEVRRGEDRRTESALIYSEEEKTPPPLKISEDVKQAFVSFSGSTNLNDLKLLSEMEETHGKDRVLEAMGIAEKRGSRRLSYVKGILQNWARDGYDGEKKPTEWKPDSGHFDPMEGLPDDMRKGWKMV